MNHQCYLLDPETTILRAVTPETASGFRPFYDLIGAQSINVLRFDDRHSLYVDEDGLKPGITSFTIVGGYPQPIAGRIALIAGDGADPYTSPLITLEDAARRFTCCRPVLDPVFANADDTTRGSFVPAGTLLGLQLRIERRQPTIVEGQA